MDGNRAARRAAAKALSRHERGLIGKTIPKSSLCGYPGNDAKSEIKEKLPEIKTTYEPIRIFRIEHPVSGKGPFTHDERKGRHFAADAMVLLKEPQDYKVAYLGCGSPHHYAFVDVWTMWGAINSMVLLREFGFDLTEYESNESIVLPCGQVAFIKEKATKIRSFPIHEFPFDEYT